MPCVTEPKGLYNAQHLEYTGNCQNLVEPKVEVWRACRVSPKYSLGLRYSITEVKWINPTFVGGVIYVQCKYKLPQKTM